MEKQPKTILPVADNELENVTAGSFENGSSYATDQCGQCGQIFRGDSASLERQEKQHSEETGHSQFRPID